MATSTTLKDLISLGGNVRITEKFTSTVLKDCVRLAVNNNTHITIVGTSLTSTVLKDLVRIGGKNVTIEI